MLIPSCWQETSIGRVVVGQRHDIQPRLGRSAHHLGRRLLPVTGVGVGVEVDAHGPRLGQRVAVLFRPCKATFQSMSA
jgi:hypothetical protein